MNRTWWIVPVVLLTFVSLAGAQQATSPAPAADSAKQRSAALLDCAQQTGTDPTFHERHPRYRLQAGDSVEVSFPLSPEFNQTLTVQPDGFVTLRDAGDLHVQGETTQQLTAEIRKAYARILHEPIISVVLKEFEKPYFIASGEVRNPGKYDLRGHTRLTEAVAMAGGFTDAARHSEVYLFRRVTEDAIEVKKLNIKRMLAKENLDEDPVLRPGDMLHVPQNTLSKLKGFILPRAVIGPTITPKPR